MKKIVLMLCCFFVLFWACDLEYFGDQIYIEKPVEPEKEIELEPEDKPEAEDNSDENEDETGEDEESDSTEEDDEEDNEDDEGGENNPNGNSEIPDETDEENNNEQSEPNEPEEPKEPEESEESESPSETEEPEVPEEPEPPEKPEQTEIIPPSPLELDERKWTVLIYMSCDNNLESAAMEDLCEMECSSLNTQATTVLMLVDRSPAYDTSDGNWPGTRLYRLNTGRLPESKQMISDEIECRDLGLSVGTETELDMSSDYVLANFISYGRNRFPAEHYALIMWGHGTGWRSVESDSENCGLFKGFAYDETSKTYMTLHQMGTALKTGLTDMKLDVLGFDTCFGGELEVMYELYEYADYCVATEGLLMSSGWNYEQLFSDFQKDGEGTVSAFCNAIVEQFKKQYAYSFRASVCVVDMEKVPQLFECFDGFTKSAAEQITDSEKRDGVLETLYTKLPCNTEKYTYGTAGNDIYLDIYSMINNLKEYLGEAVPAEAYSNFIDADAQTVINSWASDRERGGLGVYFSSLTTGNLLSAVHPAAYIKGRTVDQIRFVQNSTGYVPGDETGESLIEKIFYTSFEN